MLTAFVSLAILGVRAQEDPAQSVRAAIEAARASGSYEAQWTATARHQRLGEETETRASGILTWQQPDRLLDRHSRAERRDGATSEDDFEIFRDAGRTWVRADGGWRRSPRSGAEAPGTDYLQLVEHAVEHAAEVRVGETREIQEVACREYVILVRPEEVPEFLSIPERIDRSSSHMRVVVFVATDGGLVREAEIATAARFTDIGSPPSAMVMEFTVTATFGRFGEVTVEVPPELAGEVAAPTETDPGAQERIRDEVRSAIRATELQGSFEFRRQGQIRARLGDALTITGAMREIGSWQQPHLLQKTYQRFHAGAGPEGRPLEEVKVFVAGDRAWRSTETGWVPVEGAPVFSEYLGPVLEEPIDVVSRTLDRASDVSRSPDEEVGGVRCHTFALTVSGEAVMDLLEDLLRPLPYPPGDLVLEEAELRLEVFVGQEDGLIRRTRGRTSVRGQAGGQAAAVEGSMTTEWSRHGQAQVEIPPELAGEIEE